MNKELKGQRYKNASGRETYEIFDAEPAFLKKFARVLQEQFGFRQQGEKVVDLDVVFMNFINGNIMLQLGWDNWTGCSLDTQQPEGDEHVITIGNYMDTVLSSL